MTSQKEIRQVLQNNLGQLVEPGQDLWLIQGDFDHFKMVNELYGCLITDYLLDWSIEVLAATLQSYESRLGIGQILWNVTGDDVTIYLPPGTLPKNIVAQLLHTLRSAIQESFYQRYAVCALQFDRDFFAGLPIGQVERLKIFLESRDIILDLAPRAAGRLALFPVSCFPWDTFLEAVRAGEASASCQAGLRSLISLINSYFDREVVTGARWDWLSNPLNHQCYVFNHGYVYPPSISFAACSARSVLPEYQNRPWSFPFSPLKHGASMPGYERLSCACQAGMQVCKRQRSGVYLGAAPGISPQESHGTQVTVPEVLSRLAWASERCLRERLYFQLLGPSTLVQINPLYTYPAGVIPTPFTREQYRGNQYGMGLKGINACYGQRTANRVIRRLLLTLAGLLAEHLEHKGLSPTSLPAAVFVDRFTIACDRSSLTIPDLVRIGRRLVEEFNHDNMGEVTISHLRINIARSSSPQPGYVLLQRLAQTQHCGSAAAVVYADDQVEVQDYSPTVAQEGQAAIESSAAASGLKLARRFLYWPVRIYPQQGEPTLDRRPNQQGIDQRANPNWAAQQPAQGDHADFDDAARQADAPTALAFDCQHQGIAWAGAGIYSDVDGAGQADHRNR